MFAYGLLAGVEAVEGVRGHLPHVLGHRDRTGQADLGRQFPRQSRRVVWIRLLGGEGRSFVWPFV